MVHGNRPARRPRRGVSREDPDRIRTRIDRIRSGALRRHRDRPRLSPISDACRATGTAAVVGAAVADDARLLISALVFGPDGRVLGRADKQHLFASEVSYYAAGESACTFELDGWHLGLGICYDSGFPEHARAAAVDGCHAYLVGALFGRGGGERQYRTWFPARAIDNTIYSVLANHVGPAGKSDAAGGSGVWGPYGEVVAQAPSAGEAVVCADLDPGEIARVREELTMLRDLAAGPGVGARRRLSDAVGLPCPRGTGRTAARASTRKPPVAHSHRSARRHAVRKRPTAVSM
ncbi:carbon-nitrogen hydrolase family protein [Yinghuangia aomiensis]